MTIIKYVFATVALLASSANYAANFEFDRPGEGMGTATVPVGQLAWEQGLPSVYYQESNENGVKVKNTLINADTLLRTGLFDGLELQLGWSGPIWLQRKFAGQTIEDNGLGDVSIGLKKSIALPDEKLSMALLARATLATGNSGFSQEKDSYALASALKYQYDELLQTGITMNYEWQDGQWAVSAMPTISYRLSDKWTGFSEWVYHKAESQAYESRLNSGLLYAVNDRVQLDASVGVAIDGGPKSYFTGLGLAVLF